MLRSQKRDNRAPEGEVVEEKKLPPSESTDSGTAEAEPSEDSDAGRAQIAEQTRVEEPPETSPSPQQPVGEPDDQHMAEEFDWEEEPPQFSILQGIGRVFITVGLLVLSFLGYQLWGTNAVTDQSQVALAKELEKTLQVVSSSGGAQPPSTATPATGAGIAKIKIPKIAIDKVVVEGVDDESLKKGPGHYPGTPMPGQSGNVVISGHRTTYGQPFYRLDELDAGDSIVLEDASGTHTYRVTETKVVLPTDLSVLVPSTDARLTLTTCHPRFSAKQRLIVVAQLEGPPR